MNEQNAYKIEDRVTGNVVISKQRDTNDKLFDMRAWNAMKELLNDEFASPADLYNNPNRFWVTYPYPMEVNHNA